MGRTLGAKNKPKDGKTVAKSNKQVTNVTGFAKTPKPERVYEYTLLASTSLGATSLYNLYGVIIDAQIPRKVESDHEKIKGKYRQ